MNKPKITHDSPPPFEQRDNEYTVGGSTLTEIEMLVGRTPFYAYDRKLLENKVSALKEALPDKISLHYAIKANPYPSLVNFMKPLVKGFDVASKKEMLLAIQSGMPANEISFAGPGKTEDDIRASIIAGITLHTESPTEISRSITLGKELNIKPNIAIRVNPAFELKASGMKMAGGAKPFGIDQELLPELLKSLDYKAINFRGFHIFAGSQNLNIDAIIEMHQKTFALANELVEMTPVSIDYINIGGGLGIPYFPGEKRLDLTEISNNLTQLISDFSLLKDIEIIMELGRYLVGEAGIYVSKVVDIKESRDTKYAVCDGGLHHHLANSGNFGQVIRKNYPVAVGNKLNCTMPNEKVNVVGPLCTPLDILADKVELPPIEINDYIVVFQSGAYGASASPQNFLSQPSLSEILL
ncbi:pyridoxal-dependent decarboxylase, exosortase A system-associated [Thalassotalea sp. M1531]|uniref:Pyridoxal-dependent decarboxylase, exosortase A system-associated n=1 Tax=Thalassotalea algicola TaxID=2716224 RepID=A0A7Y0L9X7_9GAMM|nr:pyridoxal-dependent decarboxylase, exosortase A system-associated [Thalassotalea algicola]NMP30536.1 pyridoxal-dependent decarboxylase, exosortase A system-associated [Thalassotalea algicola]